VSRRVVRLGFGFVHATSPAVTRRFETEETDASILMPLTVRSRRAKAPVQGARVRVTTRVLSTGCGQTGCSAVLTVDTDRRERRE